MAVEIATAVLDAIIAEAALSDREICGLLFGRAMRIDARMPCVNVAADVYRAFEIDPSQLLQAHRSARAGGPAIIGHYHSHPIGPPSPSARDAQSAAPDGMLWLIAARSGAGLYRAVKHGSIHGRFDPLAMRPI